MIKYRGIDLHSNSRVLVTDEADRIIFQKRLAISLNEILPALAPHREETVGVMVESTYNWYWLVDGMMNAGYQVHLAHPSAIKKYEGLKYMATLPMPPILRICFVYCGPVSQDNNVSSLRWSLLVSLRCLS